jgi:HSP20 family protein
MTPWFDFDRFFEDFEPSLLRRNAEKAWAPAVDIFEDEKEIVIKAHLPEVQEKDVDIRVEDGQMTIKGERKFEHEEKKDNYHRVERRYGSFQRTFALPETVDAEHIVAKYDKGVLKVTLPKVEKKAKNARTIPVK